MDVRSRVTEGDYIRVPSDSSTAEYKVYAINTEHQYCTCPAWKNKAGVSQKRAAALGFYTADDRRYCKHILKLMEHGVME